MQILDSNSKIGQKIRVLLLILQPESSGAAVSAVRLAEVLCEQGRLAALFFHGAGCGHARQGSDDATLEYDAPKRWARLHQRWGVPLLVCHTAAQRTGRLPLPPPFQCSSLQALAELMQEVDRVVQF